MAIKPIPHTIPSTLPPAKLYLDDITEIVQILTDSSPDYHATFVAGQTKCDSIDDLKELRGRATHFVMNISSPRKHQTLELTPAATRIHIDELGDQLLAWSKYVNVAAIFERRKLRLKSVVRSLAPLLLAGLVASGVDAVDVRATRCQTPLHRRIKSHRDRHHFGGHCCVLLHQLAQRRVLSLSEKSRHRKMAGRPQARNYRRSHLRPDGSDRHPSRRKNMEMTIV